MNKEAKEKSVFLQVFGDNPKLRVIDFLITFPRFDYSITDIARNSHVGYSTLMLFWSEFVKTGIVEETREVGKARMFKLNEKNPAVKQILKMDWALSKYFVHKMMEKEAIKVHA